MTSAAAIAAWLERRPAVRDAVVASLLAIVSVVLYAPTWNHDFINYDDDHYVYRNPQVTSGVTLENVLWAFSTTEMGSWHPLTWLTLQFDAEFWGSSPAGFHLGNFLFHAVNVALVYLVFQRFTGSVLRSVMVALLFGLHPLRVESVAWISERKDVLSGFFWLLTMLAYHWYVLKPTCGRMALVVAGFALGLASKPMVITLPCVFLLLDFWPLRRLGRLRDVRPLIVEKIPLFAMMLVFAYMTFVSQNRGGMMKSTDELSLTDRLANVPNAFCAYLWKTIYPVDLGLFYPHSAEARQTVHVLLACLCLAVITAAAFRLRHRMPYLLFGWLWFVGTLIPVIGLVQVGDQAYADRYTYLPHLGLFVALVWGIGDLLVTIRARHAVIPAVGIVSVVICFAMARRQIDFWQNSTTIWKRSVAVTEPNDTASCLLGSAYLNEGRLTEALDCYVECCRLRPELLDYRVKTALLYRDLDRLEEAERECQLAEKLRKYQRNEALPQYFRVRGDVNARLDQWKVAIVCYGAALKLEPSSVVVRTELGLSLLAIGRIDDARVVALETCQLDPSFPFHLNRDAFELATDVNASKIYLARACHLSRLACLCFKSAPPDFLDTLAIASAAAGQFDAAITTGEQALQAARETHRAALLPDLTDRLRLYREHRPYRP